MLSLPPTSALTFACVQVHTKGDKVMFFINDPMAADSLKEISGRIQSKTGPIKVFVHASDPPLRRKGTDNGGTEGERGVGAVKW